LLLFFFFFFIIIIFFFFFSPFTLKSMVTGSTSMNR
jgi:hypothetical protein